MSLTVSVDAKQHWTVLRIWSQEGISNFALVLVVFKRRRGSERVKLISGGECADFLLATDVPPNKGMKGRLTFCEYNVWVHRSWGHNFYLNMLSYITAPSVTQSIWSVCMCTCASKRAKGSEERRELCYAKEVHMVLNAHRNQKAY